jgi:hypothetical protein
MGEILHHPMAAKIPPFEISGGRPFFHDDDPLPCDRLEGESAH